MERVIELNKLAAVRIEEVNKSELVDVMRIALDLRVPEEEREKRIMELIKNPYCFRVGDVGVKLEFAEVGESLQERLTAFLIGKKNY